VMDAPSGGRATVGDGVPVGRLGPGTEPGPEAGWG
jgi:hypothetical protein